MPNCSEIASQFWGQKSKSTNGFCPIVPEVQKPPSTPKIFDIKPFQTKKQAVIPQCSVPYIMAGQYPCLADLLPAGCEVGEVGEVAALLLAVAAGDLRLHLHRPHSVLLGHTHRPALSQHPRTEPGYPSHLQKYFCFYLDQQLVLRLSR